jgi:GNAT superfamily N-acetyltransferase
VNIRPLKYSDLALAARLQPEGWPDIMPYLAFYTQNTFCHPLKATDGDLIVGTGTAIIHADTAWLGHIIVHADSRNKGIGQLVTRALIDQAHAMGITTIYLIATDMGEPVYQKAGFETEAEYLFFKDIEPDPIWAIAKNIAPITDDIKKQVTELDRHVSGEDRLLNIEQYLDNGYVYIQGGSVTGFYLPAWGEGHIIAGTSEAGQELMKLRFQAKNNASFPADNTVAAGFLQQHGYQPFKTAKRMRLGPARTWQAGNIYNRIGGNLG